MADPRDDLDAWMNAQVQPLPPPPGTFELIRKRARRRKMTRAAVAAAGAAAVIAVIAVVPRLVITQLQLGPSSSRGAAAGQTSSAGPARSHASTAPATPSAAGSGSPPATALPPAPPNFAATSVTFVGTETGYVLGQAGTPGQCQGPNPDICTSLAGTGDGGRSWHGVSAPVTGAPDGAAGVSQLRFYDTADGWAFGPGLWATHDGGHTWSQVSTGGLRVLALETAGADITVNTVCPAYIRTPLVDAQIAAQAGAHGISEQEVIERIMLEPMPKKQFITTEEVAATIEFLASHAARNITGQTIVIDGGWTAR